MERDFKGIWIPKEIYLNKELSWSEKILLIEIDSLDNEKGCFASNSYFAEFLGISETRISKMISKLKKLDYIRQESFNGRERILRSNIKIALNKSSNQDKADLNKSSKQDSTKVQGRQEEKFKHNNIVNNTVSNITNIVDEIEQNEGKCPEANKIPYKDIIEYLNTKAETKYKYTTKATKDKIKARWNEEYTVEDFKSVIDKKCTEWLNTDMQKFLRPETLFGNKFEGYLNQCIKINPKDIQVEQKANCGAYKEWRGRKSVNE